MVTLPDIKRSIMADSTILLWEMLPPSSWLKNKEIQSLLSQRTMRIVSSAAERGTRILRLQRSEEEKVLLTDSLFLFSSLKTDSRGTKISCNENVECWKCIWKIKARKVGSRIKGRSTMQQEAIGFKESLSWKKNIDEETESQNHSSKINIMYVWCYNPL